MNRNIKSAIITGATGMIGKNLIEYLLSNNITVLALVKPGTKEELLNYKGIDVQECDLMELKNIDLVQKNYDAFFHLGWIGTYGSMRDNAEIQKKNIDIIKAAVDLAKSANCKIFMGAGSQAEYGLVKQKISSNISPKPITEYGKAKLEAGNLSRELCHKYNICHIWPRILSVYGPYDTNNTMITNSIDKMLKNENICYTKGEQMWDYLYVEDAVRALFLLANFGMDGKTYIIGSGNCKPLSEYINVIKKVLNSKSQLLFGKIPYVENQVMYLCADISDLQNDVGFNVEISFSEGIKKTLSWYQKIR